MIYPLFLYHYFKDITDRIDLKYFLNIKLKDYELFTINIFNYDSFYNFFNKKESLNVLNNFSDNFLDNIIYMANLTKNNNYNKENIIILYAYLCYIVLINSKINILNLTNSYYLNNKINKEKEFNKFNYNYYNFRLNIYLNLDLIVRHISAYPDIRSYLTKASLNCYRYYKYINKLNIFKIFSLKLLSKITEKTYLFNSKYIDLTNEYNELINKSLNLIDCINDYLYYNNLNKLKAFFNS